MPELDLLSARLSSDPATAIASDGSTVVAGEVATITVEDQDSGFIVGSIRDPDDLIRIRFIGRDLPGVEIGAFVRFQGNWQNDPVYGEQFQVSHVEAHLPLTADAIVRYIKQNVSKCGEAAATKVVSRLGLRCLETLSSDPSRISEVFPSGKTRENMIVSWTEWAGRYHANRAAENIYARLFGIEGMTTSRAKRIVSTFGADEAERVVLHRPYELTRVPGIAFRTADQIATRLGMALDNPMRIVAGLVFALEKAMEEGHSALPKNKIVLRARKILQLEDSSLIHTAIESALASGHIVERHGLLFKDSVDRQEAEVAEKISILSGRQAELDPFQWLVVDSVLIECKVTDRQAEAVRGALQSGVFILTGGPGTGKTTTVRAFLRCCEALGWGDGVVVAAPTGKAASRASEVTGKPASTVHRLLGVGFGKFRKAPLQHRFIVLDEVSMCDLPLVAWLLRNLDLDRCSVLLVGDCDQLPSVGHGRVLADLIESGVVPSVELTEVHRQAAGSMITTNAHRILQRKPLDLTRKGADSDFLFADVSLEEEVVLDDNGFPVEDLNRSRNECLQARERMVRAIRYLIGRGADPISDIQVLTPMKMGLLGVTELNRLIQAEVNARGLLGPQIGDGNRVRVGDRVIQVKNDYKINVFNGDQGEVVGLENNGRAVVVRFAEEKVVLEGSQLKNLQLSWAITVHRSQGSEFPYAILMYHTSHHLMLSRSLLYTAVTRAKRQFILIGNYAAVEYTLKLDDRAEERHTALGNRLLDLHNRVRSMDAA